jgi:hypothetical protein
MPSSPELKADKYTARDVPPVCTASKIQLSRLRYLTPKIHALGPRPLFEMLRELAGGADLASVLERYAGLEP